MGIETTTPTQESSTPTGDSNYDEFASMFESLTEQENTSESTTPSTTDAGAASNSGDDDQSGEPTSGEGGSGEPAAAPANPPTDDGQGQPAPESGDPSGGDEGGTSSSVEPDWKKQFEALQAQVSEMKRGQEAAIKVHAPEPAPEVKPIYSEPEVARINELKKDWPEMVELFSLLGRQLQHDTLTYAFSEVERVISPMQSQVSVMANDSHMDSIYATHGDYDEVYQPVLDWIEKQPSFLKAAYQGVASKGTAEEVSAMISQFKQQTGWKGSSQPAPKPAAPAVAAPAVKPVLSDGAKKAAAAIGAVNAKRGGGSDAEDPNDFEGTWARINPN